MKKQERKVVVGIGEIIAGDYGLGKHAVRRLQESRDTESTVEFVETGTVGADMEQLIEESSHLLVLDAVDVGRMPGTIVEFDEADPELLSTLHRLPHQVEFHEILEHAVARNAFPEHVHFIGVQPGSFTPGFELSGEVREAIPSVLQRATTVLETWEQ
jgi:hydrogenase maturation protease